jgi:hypothetical protein
MTPTGIEPATCRLGAQCFNQLRHHVLDGQILYKILAHMSQKISVAIADQMLLVLNSDTITGYAQHNTKLANTLNGQNTQSLLPLYVLLQPLFKTDNRSA